MNGNVLNEAEVGASDNRLSLSIGEHPEIQNWQDGNEYVFSEVRVRQRAPGEFEVVSVGAASGGEAAPAAEPAPEAEPEMPMEEEPAEYPGPAGRNPALRRFLG